MGFFGKIKQGLGIGTIKVKLVVDDTFSRNSDTISGKIVLTAKSDQQVTGVDAKLEEVRKIGRGDNEKVETFELGEWEDKTAFTMKANEEKAIPFSLKYQLMKSRNDRIGETAKVLGGLGKLMDGEKSTFNITASCDVKSAVFGPNDLVELKLVD